MEKIDIPLPTNKLGWHYVLILGPHTERYPIPQLTLNGKREPLSATMLMDMLLDFSVKRSAGVK